MEEVEKTPAERLAEQTADGCVCPECGYDVQPKDIKQETVREIAETYWYPYCPECNLICKAFNSSHWYPEE